MQLHRAFSILPRAAQSGFSLREKQLTAPTVIRIEKYTRGGWRGDRGIDFSTLKRENLERSDVSRWNTHSLIKPRFNSTII